MELRQLPAARSQPALAPWIDPHGLSSKNRFLLLRLLPSAALPARWLFRRHQSYRLRAPSPAAADAGLIDDNRSLPRAISRGVQKRTAGRGWPPAETKETTLCGTQKSTRQAGWMAGEYAIHYSLGPTNYSEPGPSHMTKMIYIGGTISVLGRLDGTGGHG